MARSWEALVKCRGSDYLARCRNLHRDSSPGIAQHRRKRAEHPSGCVSTDLRRFKPFGEAKFGDGLGSTNFRGITLALLSE
jgi:hypothetical protein